MNRLPLWVAVLAASSVLGSAERSQAQDIRGAWQVRSFTLRTQTLDGKKTVKGPTTYKNSNTKIQINDDTYVETNMRSRVTYALQKEGKDYLLRRQIGENNVEVRLTNIRKTANELRFTSVSRNEQKNEKMLADWVYTALKPQSLPPHPLKGTQWELVEILYNNDKIVHPQKGDTMMVAFRFGNQLVGKAGNNRFTGFYTPGTDRALTISRLAATRMADAPDSIAATFLKDLEGATQYRIDKGFLLLELPDSAGTLKLRKIPD
jgi:heat shock protein HslJ